MHDSYDPKRFAEEGHAAIDAVADHLRRALAGGDAVLTPVDPLSMVDRYGAPFDADPVSTVAEVVERALADSIHLHHPRYVGHQVSAPLPAAALFDMVSSILNNGMAVFEMGQAATAMELRVVSWMTELMGWGPQAGGILTSGGSVGNLTALLAARQSRAGFDAWAEGDYGGKPLAVLAAQESHYSVKRAVQIMGWGSEGCVLVPVDTQFRMAPESLGACVEKAEIAGRRVIGVVANACSTSTGAYDPLEPIADFCANRGLWLHVDGAHGAAALLSPKYAHLLKGVERADSAILDAHKMLMMPALVTGVLFRDGHDSYAPFRQVASYLYGSGDAEEEWFNVGNRTLECTKRMMCLKLYGALRVFGTRMFADYVTQAYDLARSFAWMLRESRDFELAVEPQSNIVCFRYSPERETDLDALQVRIRERIIASGEFYLVQTRLPHGIFLRVSLMNPMTTEAHLEQLMRSIRSGSNG